MKAEDKQWITERYMERFRKYGMDIRTLASGNRDRQLVRFQAFSGIGDLNGASILDVGCGFGDFYQYLKDEGIKVKYTGIDICPAFVDVCTERFPEAKFAVKDLQTDPVKEKYDYVVSSQTFNNRLADGENMRIMKDVLQKSYALCTKGVAVDMVTSYVDFQEEHLFYYSPEEVFKFAKTITKRVTLRHDYPLYEFMICLYKDFKGWRNSL